jgi:hypothetical protein
MIIGTPFMHKHGLALDFGKNTLSTQGILIPTLTTGQEDLMLVKRRTVRAHTHAPVERNTCSIT